jgi:aminopeptidase-like protein
MNNIEYSQMLTTLAQPALCSPTEIGFKMYQLIADLYPICRSITGNGFRESLALLGRQIPLERHEIPTGTRVFDWTIPKEWNIRDAWVKDSHGKKVIDFQLSNLHLVNYSLPIHRIMSLTELKEHLFSLPDKPDCVPYRTSYYREDWGFCLTYNSLVELEEGDYEVLIDSTLEPGHLTYGELLLPGRCEDEVLISCHCCHPSLCNDNLSGMALATFLAKHLSGQSLRYTYRFLFVPGTIGSISWLCQNEQRTKNIKHGLVVACVGDRGRVTYKRSRKGNAEIDRAVLHLLKHSHEEYNVKDYSPYGYDERQYCSPGFDLAVGSLTRTPYGEYPEYHTSADNLEFVRPEALADSFSKYLAVIEILEHNKKFRNTNPKCEPQLGKRGIYGIIGGKKDIERLEMALLWVLNLSDNHHTLLDIAERADMDFTTIKSAADTLLEHGLLAEIDM